MHIHEDRECRPTEGGGCGDCQSKGRLVDGPFCHAYGRPLRRTLLRVWALLQCVEDEATASPKSSIT